MSFFDRLAPFIPQVSSSSIQTSENPSVCLTPPLSLSSPIVKKKPIQITSFAEKGLIYEKHNTQQKNTDRSFVPICSSMTPSEPSWSKSCHYSQRNHGERASTLPRTKPKTFGSPTLSAKPSISIVPAPEPNFSPTLKAKPMDSLHPSASLLSDPSPFLHHPELKPRVSPTLTVPTPRLSPSPTSDGRGDKQPSPVAIERRARTIIISNTKVQPEAGKHSYSNETECDILDQETLLDFTHPALRRACPVTSPHQTYSESQRQAAATSQNSCFLQAKVGFSTKENITKDKPMPPPRNIDVTASPKTQSNIKELQDFLPSGVTGSHVSLSESEGIRFANVAQRQSQSVFDGPATQSSLSLHRKHVDFPQSRSQMPGIASNEQSYERMFYERGTTKMPFSTDPPFNQSTVLNNIETKRRRFGFSNETKVDAAIFSASALRRPQEENNIKSFKGNVSKLFQKTGDYQNIKPPQKHRFWSKSQSQTAQMDVKSAVSQSDCVSKNHSCLSKRTDQKVEAPHCAQRLNPLKKCMGAPASVERTTTNATLSEHDNTSHRYPLENQQSPGQNKRHKEVVLSDTGLNQTDIFAPPGSHWLPTKLPECPSEKCVVSLPPSLARCPFDTNSFGFSSKFFFDPPSQLQHRESQRRGQTATTKTASPPLRQPNHSSADRAFILEEPEDPYYVTMYYPGSVYVGEYTESSK